MKILFLAGHEFMYNPQNGGQKCSLRNYNLLQEVLGKENVYLCMFSNYIYANLDSNVKIFPTQRNNIQLLINTIFARNVCDRKTIQNVKKYVQKLDIDALFVDSSTIGYLVKKMGLNIPIISFFHNIEADYAKNKYRHEGKRYIVAYWSYFYNEKKTVKLSDKIIVLNKRDENELKRLYGRGADFYLPISFTDIFDDKRIKERESEKIDLLFVGSLFQPNIEGLKWFISNVMMKLDENKYILKIVGKNFETRRKELERKNVMVIGTVDDVGEYYYNADAVVLPIFYGDGMKVKTAEAMMYGKMILATDEALEGYETVGIEAIWRCNDSVTFVNILRTVEFHKYDENVRKLFKAKYDTEILKKRFAVFLRDIL